MDGMRFSEVADVKVIRKGQEVDASVAKQRWERKHRLRGIPIGRNAQCPCRSGKKNKHCHNVRRWERGEGDKIVGYK